MALPFEEIARADEREETCKLKRHQSIIFCLLFTVMISVLIAAMLAVVVLEIRYFSSDIDARSDDDAKTSTSQTFTTTHRSSHHDPKDFHTTISPSPSNNSSSHSGRHRDSQLQSVAVWLIIVTFMIGVLFVLSTVLLVKKVWRRTWFGSNGVMSCTNLCRSVTTDGDCSRRTESSICESCVNQGVSSTVFTICEAHSTTPFHRRRDFLKLPPTYSEVMSTPSLQYLSNEQVSPPSYLSIYGYSLPANSENDHRTLETRFLTTPS